MTIYKSPICKGCTHYKGIQIVPESEANTGTCDAFPAASGIPLDIWQSQWDHRKTFPGDHGITFTPKDAAAAGYAALLFRAKYASTPRTSKARPKSTKRKK